MDFNEHDSKLKVITLSWEIIIYTSLQVDINKALEKVCVTICVSFYSN